MWRKQQMIPTMTARQQIEPRTTMIKKVVVSINGDWLASGEESEETKAEAVEKDENEEDSKVVPLSVWIVCEAVVGIWRVGAVDAKVEIIVVEWTTDAGLVIMDALNRKVCLNNECFILFCWLSLLLLRTCNWENCDKWEHTCLLKDRWSDSENVRNVKSTMGNPQNNFGRSRPLTN